MSVKVCIGVDQSYKRTGISVSEGGKLVSCQSVKLDKLESKPEKRNVLRARFREVLESVLSNHSPEECVVVLERVRTFSQQFLSVPYIKSMGALNAVVSDEAWYHGVQCYNVDTRAWKHGVVGTSKPAKPGSADMKFAKHFQIDDKKAPTARWVYENYKEMFKENAVLEVAGRRKKGTFIAMDGTRCEIDDDLCDSACISLSWFKMDSSKFQLE